MEILRMSYLTGAGASKAESILVVLVRRETERNIVGGDNVTRSVPSAPCNATVVCTIYSVLSEICVGD